MRNDGNAYPIIALFNKPITETGFGGKAASKPTLISPWGYREHIFIYKSNEVCTKSNEVCTNYYLHHKCQTNSLNR